MSGEEFFKLFKGNEFKFSNFKEIKEEDLKGADEKIKKLFNVFAGDDKILQKSEANSLFNALKSIAGNNNVLEEDEIRSFVKEQIGEDVDTNLFATFVNDIFGIKENSQNQATQITTSSPTNEQQQTFLEETACKDIAIDIINENLSEAYEILNSQYLGAISGWHDEKKDKNDILKTSNVSKVLNYQRASIEWMNKAKLAPPNGLSRKEYYESNKQRIKDMIITRILVLDTHAKFQELKNKHSEEELAQIIGDYVEQLCSNASMKDLKDIQKQIVSYSSTDEIQALEKFIDNAIEFNTDKNSMPQSERPLPKYDNSKGVIPDDWNTDEPISFEEVYKIERGVEYSQEKIERYALAKKEMEIVANAYNKKQQFIEFAEGLQKDETLSADEKAQKILEGFADFYSFSEDGGLSQLKELITKSKLPITIDGNKFDFGILDDNAKNRALNSLLKIAQQSKEAEFKEFLKGKTIEEYQTALAQTQEDAIGEENGKMLAEAMKNDNLTCIQKWTGSASMAGMGMTVVGGVLCFTPLAPLGAIMVTVGNTVAIGGMVAETGLGVADYATKEVQTQEEAEELGKNFLMNAGGFIVGIGAGKAGLKAFNKLIDKKLVAVFGEQIAKGNKAQALKTVFSNPEYLKSFMTAAGAKLSADFVISYAGDLAMMGILDTNDDWQSLLKANLTGILVGMSGDIKDVSGVNKSHNHRNTTVAKPMTELDYGQRLLGNDVVVGDPKTGASVEGTVTGVHNQNGQVEIEVNGQKFSTNDVEEVRENTKISNDIEVKEIGKSELEVEYNDYKGLSGSITIKNSQGEQLGNVNYSILEQNGKKVLKFEGLESKKSGMNIGTKLIEELVMKSIELGAEGRLIAEASPSIGSGANGRPMSNLGFYYKLGFKADDPTIDAKIRECIESGKEIPLSLNIFTKISLTEEGINAIIANSKNGVTAKGAVTETNIKTPNNNDKTNTEKLIDILGSIKNDKGECVFNDEIKILDNFNGSDSQLKKVLSAVEKQIKKGELRIDNYTIIERIKKIIPVLSNENHPDLKEIKKFSEILAQQYKDMIEPEVNDIFKYFLGDADIEKKEKSYTAKGENGEMSARSKSSNSVYSKIRKYSLELKNDLPTNKEEADILVGDAGGFRYIINRGENRIAQKIISEIVPENERIEFNKYFNESYKLTPEEKSKINPKFIEYEKKIIEKAIHAQSDEFVTKLCEGIDSGKISLQEIDNYCGHEGIPYFSQEHIQNITLAYNKWFDKMSKNPDYKVKIDDASGLIEYIEDKNGNKFRRVLPIENSQENPEAIKASGYTSSQFNIIGDNGLRIEFQYRSSEINEFAEYEHVPYDIREDKETVNNSKYDEIRSVLKDKNKMSDDEYKNIYNPYLTQVYNYYRRVELGLPVGEMPVLNINDFKNLTQEDIDLISVDGLRKLHETK